MPASLVRTLLASLAIPLLVGCESSPLAPAPDDVETFIRESGLPRLASYRVLLADATSATLVFEVSFGYKHDCEAGCFTSHAVGLRHEGRTGWLQVSDYDSPGDTLRHEYYDFSPADEYLFSSVGLALLREPTKYLAWDGNSRTYPPFAYRLIGDPDTPEATLVELAERLPEDRYGYGIPLVRVTAERSSRTVLEAILALDPSGWDPYGEVQQEARDALARLSAP